MRRVFVYFRLDVSSQYVFEKLSGSHFHFFLRLLLFIRGRLKDVRFIDILSKNFK